MIQQRLKTFLNKNKCTLLGVGPMSLNCVDAAVELANEYEAPLLLIASRRQIDSEEFDGGYVNNWTTQEFARYVIDNDQKGKILLARDHGGPWQSTKEVDENLSLRRAMDSAKLSYLRDLEAGFQVLHIDPSVDIHCKPNVDEILDRVFDLYDYCWTHAQRLGREVIFEVGTEEQSGRTNTQEELNYTLSEIIKFCKKNNIPQPSFVVIQTGTRVMETRNVGSFDTPLRVINELPAEIQVPKMIEICNHYGIMMKEHNTDYLSDEALQWHPRLGIHAANVAPEFGVAETLALLDILERNSLQSLADDFLKLSYDSKKWEKWMLDETTASDRDRSIISGHYVFSMQECDEIKAIARKDLVKKQIDLDFYLKNQVKRSIFRYMKNFRIAGG
ncbi:class II D-tagatose-bisphosphate aldolase, non-catalytic subunit [Polynucleobacter sp. MWH-UH24A]|uniref:class II D-tagatose-bisphosphate aldolase non-catalytic subunit n=1 Tax=Polynucleobacter sp. MWH-UH24A TaxID=2689110 RepID=UPI001BFDA804|nr:class II D-tagatose-bisphosphate aldolase, non-catalytic subunit [Polynucleobacter sp. MWH-UH24A]QWD76401.1 class II D-tagatose-bisphosphate aldolase, non-catalytic subunit [Polynucleobacter sp. MWH-UH24A]